MYEVKLFIKDTNKLICILNHISYCEVNIDDNNVYVFDKNGQYLALIDTTFIDLKIRKED